MRTRTLIAALLLVMTPFLQLAASAESDVRARLSLQVVDLAQRPVPGATVTIYTLDGNPGTTVVANEKGVALFPSLPTGMAQIHARHASLSPYIEKTTLRAGDNAQTVTLGVTDESE